MNDDQRVDLAFRDQPRRNGGFPKGRRRAEDTFIVTGDLRDGFLLERPKLALELPFSVIPRDRSRRAQGADDGLRFPLDDGQVGTDGDLRAPAALLPVL